MGTRVGLAINNDGGMNLDTSEWSDAREYPRSKGAWPVVIMTSRGALIAETRNISPQGAFIFCDRPPPPEEKIRVIIMFPNSRYLDLPAEVTWSYPYGSDKDDTPHGMGVKFTDISKADREFISSLSSGYLRSVDRKGVFEE